MDEGDRMHLTTPARYFLAADDLLRWPVTALDPVSYTHLTLPTSDLV